MQPKFHFSYLSSDMYWTRHAVWFPIQICPMYLSGHAAQILFLRSIPWNKAAVQHKFYSSGLSYMLKWLCNINSIPQICHVRSSGHAACIYPSALSFQPWLQWNVHFILHICSVHSSDIQHVQFFRSVLCTMAAMEYDLYSTDLHYVFKWPCSINSLLLIRCTATQTTGHAACILTWIYPTRLGM